MAKLKQLLKGLSVEVRGNKEVEITGISSDSRTLAPGDLFIAKKGFSEDGSKYILQAIASGAKAIVTDVFDPFLKVPQIIVKDPRAVEPKLASLFFGKPSEKLAVIGVTGTKGKTSTTYLVRHLLEGFSERCGLMGSIELIAGPHRFPSSHATQGAIVNQKFLKEMLSHKCTTAILEVSSHGLDQGRVDEIAFDIGVFTNLYPDHLDYHKTMENYALAKRKLFTRLREGSVVNADDSYSSFMQGTQKGISFGIKESADVKACDVVLSEKGASFTVDGVPFSSHLLGIFNVYNMLSAIAVGVLQGKSMQEMSALLRAFQNVPGRLERVRSAKDFQVFVDYSHMGTALNFTLRALKEQARARLIVVFGCGGNRDPLRRKEMAEAAEKYADIAIVTNDNPRNEDPLAIAEEVVRSFKNPKFPIVELDRKKAIALAIHSAKTDDIVLIAGKGHEKVQIFLRETIIFDDVAVAEELCR